MRCCDGSLVHWTTRPHSFDICDAWCSKTLWGWEVRKDADLSRSVRHVDTPEANVVAKHGRVQDDIVSHGGHDKAEDVAFRFYSPSKIK